MQRTFDITVTGRNLLLQFLDKYTLEQLNKIPDGFKNNLLWNMGHIVVVQQMLVYKLSGLPMMITDEMVEKYKKGTTPEGQATQEDVEEIKSMLFETLKQTQADFDAQIFKNYHEFTTLYGYTLKSAEDAMAFNTYHEALHTGIMMGIRKVI